MSITTPEATRTPALRVDDITKSFGATRALRGVGFEVAAGRVHALLGGNGSGKSTLIRILAGVERADGGTVEAAGAVADARHASSDWADAAGLRFVHQGAPSFPSLTVLDDFALSAGYGARSLGQINRRALRRRAREALDRFGVAAPLDARMSELRPATRTMIAVARALRDDEASVLVLDEPTAALPSAEADRLLEAIRGYAEQGHTVILVSHRLNEILAVAETATFLRDGALVQTRPLAGMDERSLIELIAESDEEEGQARRFEHTGRIRLALEHFAAGPLQDVNLEVEEGEIVGLSGLLGSGRTSLLQGVFGARPVRAGSITLDGEPISAREPAEAVRLGIAYVPEDRAADAAFGDRSVRENFSIADMARYCRGLIWGRREEAADARAAMEKYRIVTSSEAATLSSLSGGNQQKVIMARWLHIEPRVLLLDEPTQGVDVAARDAIHGFVRDAADGGAAVLVASSDPEELVLLCDRVVGLYQGRITGEAKREGLTSGRALELAHGIHQTGEEVQR